MRYGRHPGQNVSCTGRRGRNAHERPGTRHVSMKKCRGSGQFPHIYAARAPCSEGSPELSWYSGRHRLPSRLRFLALTSVLCTKFESCDLGQVSPGRPPDPRGFDRSLRGKHRSHLPPCGEGRSTASSSCYPKCSNYRFRWQPGYLLSTPFFSDISATGLFS